jgi:hypothetical protein
MKRRAGICAAFVVLRSGVDRRVITGRVASFRAALLRGG